jgi:hypothetical protein
VSEGRAHGTSLWPAFFGEAQRDCSAGRGQAASRGHGHEVCVPCVLCWSIRSLAPSSRAPDTRARSIDRSIDQVFEKGSSRAKTSNRNAKRSRWGSLSECGARDEISSGTQFPRRSESLFASAHGSKSIVSPKGGKRLPCSSGWRARVLCRVTVTRGVCACSRCHRRAVCAAATPPETDRLLSLCFPSRLCWQILLASRARAGRTRTRTQHSGPPERASPLNLPLCPHTS